MNGHVPDTESGVDTTADHLDGMLSAAQRAVSTLEASSPRERAAWIDAAADALDGAVDDLVPIAARETRLPQARLRGEVARSSGQLRLFADALRDGSLLELVVDTADPDFKPVPRPDLRRMLFPLGPVLVFAASNFPFAFSVCGGDTTSALAAGCPVLVKAHPGHPQLSDATADVITNALHDAGAPEGTLGLAHGQQAGLEALKDPRIRASAFTGSVPGGLALHKVAANRPEPIPFYGELGSLNPSFALPCAVQSRGTDIATGYVSSYTLGVGQFCTKPGLLFLPAGHGLDQVLISAAREVDAAAMLNARIHDSYTDSLAQLRRRDSVDVLVSGEKRGLSASVSLLRTTVPRLLTDADTLLQECFGPVSIIVEYSGTEELLRAAGALGGQLTATLHADDADSVQAATLLPLLQSRAGRIVINGWPTGVAVTRAMQHGGPFPATVGSIHTSVGTTAARRFQRPISFQNTPQPLLPEALRDTNPQRYVRCVNGEMTRESVTSATSTPSAQ